MTEREYEFIRESNKHAVIEAMRSIDPNYQTPVQRLGTMALHAAQAHPYVAAGVGLAAVGTYVYHKVKDSPK